jgi:hypothetical protein
MKLLLSLAAMVGFCTLISCAGTSTVKGIAVPGLNEIELPDHITINVVQIPQHNNYSCATTSVAMAISHFEGLDLTPLDQDAVFALSGADINTLRNIGNDMRALARITNHYGYQSEYASNMTFHDLEFLLSKGILVVINIKRNVLDSYSHAVLLTGYDRVQKVFYFNDPATRNPGSKLSYSDLDRQWFAQLSSPSGLSINSGFIIYPKVKN